MLTEKKRQVIYTIKALKLTASDKLQADIQKCYIFRRNLCSNQTLKSFQWINTRKTRLILFSRTAGVIDEYYFKLYIFNGFYHRHSVFFGNIYVCHGKVTDKIFMRCYRFFAFCQQPRTENDLFKTLKRFRLNFFIYLKRQLR